VNTITVTMRGETREPRYYRTLAHARRQAVALSRENPGRSIALSDAGVLLEAFEHDGAALLARRMLNAAVGGGGLVVFDPSTGKIGP